MYKMTFTSLRFLYAHKTQTSLWSLNLIKCIYRLQKTNRSYTCFFSAGLDLLFLNVLKEIFVFGTSSSPSFKSIVWDSKGHSKICTVVQSNMNEKSLTMSHILNNMWHRLENGSWWWWSFVKINHHLYMINF